MIIYKVTNLLNGKIYIGKTVQSLAGRKNKHLYAVRNNSNYLFHRSIRKYGEENFTWEIVDRCLFDESLTVLEKHYIKEFNCITPKGYNLTEGGEGALGFRHTPESIKKMMGQRKLRDIGISLQDTLTDMVFNAGIMGTELALRLGKSEASISCILSPSHESAFTVKDLPALMNLLDGETIARIVCGWVRCVPAPIPVKGNGSGLVFSELADTLKAASDAAEDGVVTRDEKDRIDMELSHLIGAVAGMQVQP